MATQYYKFYGKVKWARVYQPDEKYSRYTIDFYLDEPSLALFKQSQVQLQIRDDEDGHFVKFARPFGPKMVGKEMVDFGPVKIKLPEGSPAEAKIGNNSECKVEVAVYDTKKGKGHRLETLTVTKLIEYIKDDHLDAHVAGAATGGVPGVGAPAVQAPAVAANQLPF